MKDLISHPLELPARLLASLFAEAFSQRPASYTCTHCGMEYTPRNGDDPEGKLHIRCLLHGGTWRRNDEH